MFDLDRWKEIWETITRNKRRSIMTALGVFWGVFLFVILLGAGLGLGRLASSSIGDLSTNSAFFFTDRTSIPYNGMPSGRFWEFSINDLDDIKKNVKGVQYVAGINWGGMRNFSYSDKKNDYYLIGYTPDYQKINPQKIKFGRFINDVDMREKRKVCLIGSQIWKNFFPGGENPVGEVIKMNNLYLTVVGVLERGSSSITIGSNPETTVVIPNALVRQLRGAGLDVDAITVMAYDNYRILDIEDDCKKIIAANHIISPDDKKAISGFNLGQEFERMSKLFGGINLLTWFVGIGTLLAGIVGISNIMLVIVRERTQEIGIRRAIGAPPKSIITQILSESFILTFIAGIFGLSAGVGVLSVVDLLLSVSPDAPKVSWQITFGMGIMSVGIIVFGSLLAGLIPANRALQIKAVDAIREE